MVSEGVYRLPKYLHVGKYIKLEVKPSWQKSVLLPLVSWAQPGSWQAAAYELDQIYKLELQGDGSMAYDSG